MTGVCDLLRRQRELLEALKAAEEAEAALISEWADFWDVAPQALIDSLIRAQAIRNAAIRKAEGGDQ